MEFMPPVVVRLVGDIKDFQAKMAAAQTQTAAASGGISKSFNMVGAAAGIAGVAVAGLAAKMMIDGVQAAIADEKAAAKLAQTMTNLGLAHDTKPVEGMIDAMQRQYGVADDELRPAMDRLLRSTKDVDEATGALKLAMDISAGTGKDLSTVTAALGRAYDGSTTSLSRLGAGIDSAVLKTGNMKLITESLSKTFQGQAQTAANTYEGQIKRLGIAFDELKESFGYGFLDALTGAGDGTESLMKTIKELEPLVRAYGTEVGKAVSALISFARIGLAAKDSTLALFRALGLSEGAIKFLTDQVRGFLNPLGAMASGAAAAADALGRLAGTVPTQRSREEWQQFWQAAAGPVGVGGGDFGANSTDAAGKDWASFYSVNPSSQEALRRGQLAAGSLYDEFISGAGGGGGGGGAAKIKERVKPAGIAVVDGLIEGIELGKLKLPDSARSMMDKYVAGINEAVTSKREYMKRISDDFVGMLDFGAAADKAAQSGKSIVDEFVAQAEKIKDFGRNMTTLLNAGLSDTAWNQIYSMGAENGARIADALIEGNMAQNIARTNEAVGSVQQMGLQIGKDSADTFKQVGIDNAVKMLKQFMEEILPEGKTRKKLMAALDQLAKDMNRTSTVTVRTVYEGGGDWFSSTYPGVATSFGSGDFTAAAGGFDWANMDLSGIFPGGGLGGMGFADGGYVPRTGMAKVHAREFVLSNDMLAGRKSVPPEVARAVGPQLMPSITVNANTNADPYAISREIAWNLKVGVM